MAQPLERSRPSKPASSSSSGVLTSTTAEAAGRRCSRIVVSTARRAASSSASRNVFTADEGEAEALVRSERRVKSPSTRLEAIPRSTGPRAASQRALGPREHGSVVVDADDVDVRPAPAGWPAGRCRRRARGRRHRPRVPGAGRARRRRRRRACPGRRSAPGSRHAAPRTAARREAGVGWLSARRLKATSTRIAPDDEEEHARAGTTTSSDPQHDEDGHDEAGQAAAPTGRRRASPGRSRRADHSSWPERSGPRPSRARRRRAAGRRHLRSGETWRRTRRPRRARRAAAATTRASVRLRSRADTGRSVAAATSRRGRADAAVGAPCRRPGSPAWPRRPLPGSRRRPLATFSRAARAGARWASPDR